MTAIFRAAILALAAAQSAAAATLLRPSLDAESSARGTADAAYTLVEYTDFQCPYCLQGHRTVEELRLKYGSKLRHVLKHNPLPGHWKALPAARCFEAARLQSPEKSWEFYRRFFTRQQFLGEDLCRETAEDLGLDYKRLKKDAAGMLVRRRIAADIAEARRFGFEGTPNYLINGQAVVGAVSIEEFDAIIEGLGRKHLSNTRQEGGGGL